MNYLKQHIVNASSWSMLIFGLMAGALGLIGLLRPEVTLSLLGFEVLERGQRAAGDYTLTFVIASSMAAVNMGIYYVLAAWNNMQKFYLWTVPFRVLTFTVFTLAAVSGLAPINFILVGAWELVGALVTGTALWIERKR